MLLDVLDCYFSFCLQFLDLVSLFPFGLGVLWSVISYGILKSTFLLILSFY